MMRRALGAVILIGVLSGCGERPLVPGQDAIIVGDGKSVTEPIAEDPVFRGEKRFIGVGLKVRVLALSDETSAVRIRVMEGNDAGLIGYFSPARLRPATP